MFLRRLVAVFAAAGLFACPPGSSPSDAGTGGGGGAQQTGGGAATGGGGTATGGGGGETGGGTGTGGGETGGGSATGGGTATGGGGGGGGGATVILPRPNRSTPVQITSDDAVVAMVNQASGSLSLFNTSGASKTRSALVDLGAGTQPVSVAIHPDDVTAFVVLRKTRQLVKVRGINTTAPTVDAAKATLGSEPTGVALSPSGAIAVVANFGEGTVTFVDTASMTVLGTTPVGGNPRALAITNDGDGDDADETAYVTQFYGTPTAEVSDTGRTGVVQGLSLASRAVTATVELAPIATTGFDVACAPNQLFSIAINNGKAYVTHVCAAPKPPVNPLKNVFSAVSVIDLATNTEDTSAVGTTSLSTLVAAQGQATDSLLGVPVGIDFRPGTNVAYVVSQAGDMLQRVHYRGTGGRAPIILGPDAAFAQIGLRGTGGIKVPLGVAVAHSANFAYVANWAERTLSVVDLAAQSLSGDIVSEDKPAAGTKEAHELAGLKFFFTGTGRWATRGVSSCGSCHPDGLSDQMTWSFAAGPRQSIPLDGTYSKVDGADQRVLNWTGIFDELHDFELNTRGTSGGKGAITVGTVPNDTPFDLTAVVSLDGGSVLTRNDFLSGSTKTVVAGTSAVKDWDEVEAWVKTVRPLAAPTTLDPAAVTAGRALFQSNNCQSCHGGPKWSTPHVPYTPSPEKNGTLGGFGMRTEDRTAMLPNATLNTDTKKLAVEVGVPLVDGGVGNVGPERVTCAVRIVGTFDRTNPLETKPDGTQAQGSKGFNPPSLLSIAAGAPYFHHGAAKTLTEVFAPQFAAHHQAGNANFLANGGTTPAEQQQIAQLVAFLQSIDATTTPFPIPANQDLCVNY